MFIEIKTVYYDNPSDGAVEQFTVCCPLNLTSEIGQCRSGARLSRGGVYSLSSAVWP